MQVKDVPLRVLRSVRLLQLLLRRETLVEKPRGCPKEYSFLSHVCEEVEVQMYV